MSESIEVIREKAIAIAARIQEEPAFRAQVEQDPENTLVSAGLPARAVPEFLTEMQRKMSEVQGFWCICTACCVSGCGGTSSLA